MQTDHARFEILRTEGQDNTRKATTSPEKVASQHPVGNTTVPPKKTTSRNTVTEVTTKKPQTADKNRKVEKGDLKAQEKKRNQTWEKLIVTRNGRQYIEVPPELKNVSAEEEMNRIKEVCRSGDMTPLLKAL